MNFSRKIVNSLLTTLGLLSRIPVLFSYTPDFSLFPLFMPVSGLFFTVILAPFALIPIRLLHDSAISAGLILLFQYLMFNLFHFDGLLDSADALLYRTTPNNRLLILKDKSAGSFALFTGALYIIVKFSLMKEAVVILRQTVPPGRDSLFFLYAFLFLFLPAGRIAGAVIPAVIVPARTDGLGFLLKRFSRKLLITGCAGTVALSCAVLSFLYGKILPADYFIIILSAYTASLTIGVLISLIYKKKVGGFTGDAIGMAVELGELTYLIIIVEFLIRVYP